MGSARKFNSVNPPVLLLAHSATYSLQNLAIMPSDKSNRQVCASPPNAFGHYAFIFAGVLVGLVVTIAGSAGESGFVDGVGSNALLSNPVSPVLDPSGVLYFVDNGNNAIRKMTLAGKYIVHFLKPWISFSLQMLETCQAGYFFDNSSCVAVPAGSLVSLC
jgi:hypothetical protein